ncbi:Serine/threonine-protein kinase BRSK2 [Porphyridium purpureum]|uniref:Serine/threonine-protein kinase BRSK2 n=1 Tax=Porphyridium purpureum TaxID=35688 RepID=A0A5J4YTS8_PORPP|nr:Serine/threonine-protein kinase BRSK2 [Porphyridium purpureum]|eukprot:POR5190..scf236_6
MGQVLTREAGAMGAHESRALFASLKRENTHVLTLRDLVNAAPELTLPHSVPALYFLDSDADGAYSVDEFIRLVQYVQEERRMVRASIDTDADFRALIHRASEAGVVDTTTECRNNFRRVLKMRNVRYLYRFLTEPTEPKSEPGSDDWQRGGDDDCDSLDVECELHGGFSWGSAVTAGGCGCGCSDKSSFQSHEPSLQRGHTRHAAQEQVEHPPGAVDAAVMERVSLSNIHTLAQALRKDGTRENFMSWMWKLATMDELATELSLDNLACFLHVVSEDGIDLEELVFDTNKNEPLEVRAMKEFTSNGDAITMSREDFMLLADLITREYEFWESRHMDCVGPYELGRVLGMGSSGVVRAAIHVDTHERFAIKIIKQGKCSEMSRLDREMEALQSVSNHPNVVRLHEVIQSQGKLFLVMELCGGGSLVDLVRLYPDERLPEDVARYFVRQLFETLAFIHSKGVCHRDVRLENVLLANDGSLRLADFGHSGLFAPGWDMFQTALVGSMYSLSPEQIQGVCYSGQKLDVWSAGITLYMMLVGAPPFYNQNHARLMEAIVEGVYEIPGFVSDEAFDLVQLLIRVDAAERVPFEDLLTHPWFDGPETSPIMDVVKIPIDEVFRTRPDLAEMVIASTIHDHNIHFHMGNSSSARRVSPQQSSQTQAAANHQRCPASEDRSAQYAEWDLKCTCPIMDMKFSIRLFTDYPVDEKLVNAEQDEVAEARIGDTREALLVDSVVIDSRALTQPQTPRSVRGKSLAQTPMLCSPNVKRIVRSPVSSTSCVGSESRIASRCIPFDCPSLSLEDAAWLARDGAQQWSSNSFLLTRADSIPDEFVLGPSSCVAVAGGCPDVRTEINGADDIGWSDPEDEHDARDMALQASVHAGELGKRFIERAVGDYPHKMRPISSPAKILGKVGSLPAIDDVRTVQDRFDCQQDGQVFEKGPQLEVRLHEGESALFVKVCKKLKEISMNNLAQAAERQKRMIQKNSGSGGVSMKRICSEGFFLQQGVVSRENSASCVRIHSRNSPVIGVPELLLSE